MNDLLYSWEFILLVSITTQGECIIALEWVMAMTVFAGRVWIDL